MNRAVRVTIMFSLLLAVFAGSAFSQARGMIERKTWVINDARKTSEVLYWRVYLGDYDVKLKRPFPGEGTVTVDAGMNFQFHSAGYIEGNGASAKGRMNDLSQMRIRVDGNLSPIRIEDIEYIYDYGRRVATKDGRKGDFVFQLQGDGAVLEVKRFQLSEFKLQKGQYGEMELKLQKPDMLPIIGMAFSKEAASKAAAEAVSD
ncbi:MAG: hypothetical protein FWB85_03890 [Chitinispirillia bacterium]|nr:hypothetical protein [Chitinispirillia bacterium]MCL2241509.1 hypothetical protein [Chitinispirillia bacterium]